MLEQPHCNFAAVDCAVVPVFGYASSMVGMQMRQEIGGHAVCVPKIVNKYWQCWSIADVVHFENSSARVIQFSEEVV